MLKNYFKTGLRNISKHKLFSLLNIVGLAIGMSVTLLILVLLENVTNFDNFQENKDHIYRVYTEETNPDGKILWATTLPELTNLRFHILGMLDTPSNGEYYFNDEPVHKMKERQLSELHKTQIGFVFQQYHLIDDLTVYENLETPLLYQKVKGSERKGRVAEIELFVLKTDSFKMINNFGGCFDT
ncbi:MAG: hypothetical protein K9J16_14530 [Melioribacteraceae bacterium]|nr:hypothetical protein [Melioribacteraceae bacterium]MCF8356226.1 hypothetical protein [Melioribacteraceae bacterium]MCF8395633.1 hypothetical protein [Melioribacteraceae bacterium]MCF8420640.1 hypothetical protein [Melioribacteraceae bacterium]